MSYTSWDNFLQEYEAMSGTEKKMALERLDESQREYFQEIWATRQATANATPESRIASQELEQEQPEAMQLGLQPIAYGRAGRGLILSFAAICGIVRFFPYGPAIRLLIEVVMISYLAKRHKITFSFMELAKIFILVLGANFCFLFIVLGLNMSGAGADLFFREALNLALVLLLGFSADKHYLKRATKLLSSQAKDFAATSPVAQNVSMGSGASGMSQTLRKLFARKIPWRVPFLAIAQKLQGVDKDKLPRLFTRAAVVSLIITVLLTFVLWPDNVIFVLGGEGFLQPDDGYEFVDANDPWAWRARWAPGRPSSLRENVLAGSEPGTWILAPGYEVPLVGTNSPVWIPHRREPEYPHVAAGLQTGTWIPDPGYVLAASATITNPKVIWQQGVKLPHMKSAKKENHWAFDPGYSFASDSTRDRPKAAWSPGERHYAYPRVTAAPSEGRWTLDPGYRWLAPGDLRSFSPSQTIEAWRSASAVDASTRNSACDTYKDLIRVLKYTRDRYRKIDIDEVHPQLVQHLTSVHKKLDMGANLINSCFVVYSASQNADLLTYGYCLFLSEDPKCVQNSKKIRDIADTVGDLGEVPCDQALDAFERYVNALGAEQRRLQNFFQTQYRLNVPTAPRIIESCQ